MLEKPGVHQGTAPESFWDAAYSKLDEGLIKEYEQLLAAELFFEGERTRI
jgi:hypothetical protein